MQKYQKLPDYPFVSYIFLAAPKSYAPLLFAYLLIPIFNSFPTVTDQRQTTYDQRQIHGSGNKIIRRESNLLI